MADIIQLRRDIASNWTSRNPTLAQGEFGFETDTLRFKLGDGSTNWNTLTYYDNVGPQGALGPTGPQGIEGPQGVQVLKVTNIKQ